MYVTCSFWLVVIPVYWIICDGRVFGRKTDAKGWNTVVVTLCVRPQHSTFPLVMNSVYEGAVREEATQSTF